MDVAAASLVLVAYVAMFHGHPIIGGVLAFPVLTGYLFYLGAVREPRLIYRPRFKHWIFALILFFIAMVVVQRPGPIQAIAAGLMCYHYTCVCLFERTVRYVPWGAGYFRWKTISDTTSPRMYWTFILFFAAMGIGILLALFVVYAIHR